MNEEMLQVMLDSSAKRQGYGYVKLLGLTAVRARGVTGELLSDYFVSIAIVAEVAYVRAGFFRDSTFEQPFAVGVAIDLRHSLSMWREVAAAIVNGAQGRTQG
jgi:hypothetical protein